MVSPLSHFQTHGATPGLSFSAKGTGSFSNKLHSGITQNIHGLGVLKKSTTAVNALQSQVVKQIHHIRQGGLTKEQAHKMIAKVKHEANMKGEHLDATQQHALKKIGEHLTKHEVIHRPTPNLAQHGISSISQTQHVSSVSQIGDKTKITSGEIPHASGGINSSMSQRNRPPMPTSGMGRPARPPSIKLSI